MTQPSSPGAVSTAGTAPRTVTVLRVASAIVLVAAAVGAVLPEDLSLPVDSFAVGIVVAAPVLRVMTLIPDLLRESDRLFAVLALLLLAVIAAGALAA